MSNIYCMYRFFQSRMTGVIRMENIYRMFVTDKDKALRLLNDKKIDATVDDLSISIRLTNFPIAYVILFLNEHNIVVYDVEQILYPIK